MKQNDYDHVPSSSEEDLSSNTHGFFAESKVEVELRKQNKRMIVTASVALISTFLNVICLYVWLQPATASYMPSTAETPIMWNYFRT
jgi:hypothetical protein